MALQKITQVSGTAVHIPGSDIDTDRIIPARFMKCVTFDGLGEYAFHDVRFNPAGEKIATHPLNNPKYDGASILLSGTNFGCGSSREHAPQALYRYGFRAVIAESYAEIFFGNSTTLGIPCVVATLDQIAAISAAIEADPATQITIDVQARTVTYGETTISVDLAATAHEALTSGKWDPIAELLEGEAATAATRAKLPYMAA